MSSIKNNILFRIYVAFGIILLFAGAVAVQLCRLQFVQGKKWKAMAFKYSTRYETIEAVRGNILSVDGSLLATSVPQYDLHMNMFAGGIMEDKVFYEKVDSLAAKLSELYPEKSEKEYSRILRDARRDSDDYQLIRRNVSYEDLKKIRDFPIFNLGKFAGGLIVEEKNKRVLPYQQLAARTIGRKDTDKHEAIGLEGAYADQIKGENGKRLVRRIPGGAWIPVDDETADIPAKDGADIISTINIKYQDLAQSALLKQLRKNNATHGTVILMEVATGEIRAIANLTKVPGSDSTYVESWNYAINNAADPGSTFKLATYMAAFDQHKIDTNSTVDTEGGKFKIFEGLTITDAELGGGTMTAKKAFEESSNVAAARFVYDHYKDNPKEFTDKLYSFHLNEPLGLQIPGEAMPVIHNPMMHGKNMWSKFSLPEMAYGYEMKITPLQMLTFYNSVANNGKMISPIFVREIQRLGNTVEQFHARVINPKVCSDETLGKVKSMLEGVVEEGTGKTINNPLYKIAGKTGTAQIAEGINGYHDKKTYQASFCGYFPADHPKYSMIVVITNPTQGDYLAAKVAGPVFRQIADRVYASDMDINQTPPAASRLVGNTNLPGIKLGNMKALHKVYDKLGVKPLYASNSTGGGVDTSNGIAFEDTQYKSGTVPSVIGMDLSDALYILGNAGYKVTVNGSGTVNNQSVTAGSEIPKGSKITIQLQ
jgi:cell division protein FtsI (penicillin-binding protein 3)